MLKENSNYYAATEGAPIPEPRLDDPPGSFHWE
jgi:hypothetical protein